MKHSIEVRAYAVKGTVAIINVVSVEDGVEGGQEMELYLNPDQVDKLLLLLAAARKSIRENERG